jgi:hypothetical protein
MAPPTDLVVLHGTSGLEQFAVEFNKVVAVLRLLTAKLDADTGVTDTNYDALLTISTVAVAPAKIIVR